MLLGGVTENLAIGLANTACPEASCCEGALDQHVIARLLQDVGVDLERFSGASYSTALSDLVQLRSLIVTTVETLASGAAIDDATLERINGLLSLGRFAPTIERTAGGYHSVLRVEGTEPAALVAPFAYSFAQLLQTTDPGRIKRCREPRCACYFIDTSKNRTRAWCSMQRCGNRQKVAKYYRRSKENETADTSVPTV